MSDIKIDKGVPRIPAWQRGHSQQSPYSLMEVGDSFFRNRPPAQLRGNLHSFAKKNGWKFEFRSVTENGVKGTRVWRIK